MKENVEIKDEINCWFSSNQGIHVYTMCLNKTPIIAHALVTNLKTGIKWSTIIMKWTPSPLEFHYNQLLLYFPNIQTTPLIISVISINTCVFMENALLVPLLYGEYWSQKY